MCEFNGQRFPYTGSGETKQMLPHQSVLFDNTCFLLAGEDHSFLRCSQHHSLWNK